MDSLTFDTSDKLLPVEDFIRIFDICILKLTTSITSLKKIAERSQSITCTALCCKKVISLMIILFYVLKTVRICHS